MPAIPLVVSFRSPFASGSRLLSSIASPARVPRSFANVAVGHAVCLVPGMNPDHSAIPPG